MIHPTDYFVVQWLGYLQHGSLDAQEASMYGLRLAGWECIGHDYWEHFLWKVRPTTDSCWCIIKPDITQKCWLDIVPPPESPITN